MIEDPADKRYDQGEVIAPFYITVRDADNDSVTVRMSGQPAGLSLTSSTSTRWRVLGTVASDAPARDYTVTVTASDGTATVTERFTITVAAVTVADPPRPSRVTLANGLFYSGFASRTYFPRASITEDTPSWANTESASYLTVTPSGTTPAITAANARWRVEVLSEDGTVLSSAVCRLIGRATLRITWTNDGESQTDELTLSSSTDSRVGPARNESGFGLTLPTSNYWSVDSDDVFPPHSVRVSIDLLED